jgi:prephenate dehydrogenase
MKKFRITAALAAILALSMVFMASAGALALNHDHDHDDKHQHAYIFRGTETRVLSSDQTSCATIQVACYVC